MLHGTSEFISLLNNPFKFRLFLLLKLPSAFFSGVRIKNISEEKCVVNVTYNWFSKNPFKSTYFACLSMAAEMSSGALAMAQVHKREPSVSMLVIKMEALYYKKATGITQFTCDEGQKIRECIEKAASSGEAQAITVKSTGKNMQDENIADFFVTWSFKVRAATGKVHA